MPISILFWVIYLISIIFGWWGYYAAGDATWPRRFGGYVALWVLVGLLGWHVFGPALR